MREKLTFREVIAVASMLFGMFFGAGNLIFPVHMGQLAGRNVLPAVLGFIVTGVGFPLLGVAALGISRSNGLYDLSSRRLGHRYGIFFTCALYLTIGPFFAIPRCATVPFSVGFEALPGNPSEPLFLLIFTLLFFAAVLWFSLRPSGVLTWIGRILNPLFLVFLALLVIRALLDPAGQIDSIDPTGNYMAQPFFTGFLEGYNTMDAIAGLAFGIVVVNVIRGLGVEKPDAVARSTVFSGLFSCLLMALIYGAICVVGAQSRGIFATAENGAAALSDIANHYFGTAGAVILTITVTFACLKTAIGLVTSCAEAFTAMFPKSPGYRFFAVLFSVFSCLIANVGLTTIVEYSVPVLMFLYPLSISLILLALCGKYFGNDRIVYAAVTIPTFIAAIFDFLGALPEAAYAALHLDGLLTAVGKVLPFSSLGLGWICPALAGLVVGLIIRAARPRKAA